MSPAAGRHWSLQVPFQFQTTAPTLGIEAQNLPTGFCEPLETSCRGNLLINGGFENPVLDDTSRFYNWHGWVIPADFGWSFQGCPQRAGVETADLAFEIQRDDHPVSVLPSWNPEGRNRLELAPNKGINICQTVDTQPGHEYRLCFYHRKRSDTGPRQETLTTVSVIGARRGQQQDLLSIK